MAILKSKKIVTKSAWSLMFGWKNNREGFLVKVRNHDYPRTHESTLNGKNL